MLILHQNSFSSSHGQQPYFVLVCTQRHPSLMTGVCIWSESCLECPFLGAVSLCFESRSLVGFSKACLPWSCLEDPTVSTSPVLGLKVCDVFIYILESWSAELGSQISSFLRNKEFTNWAIYISKQVQKLSLRLHDLFSHFPDIYLDLRN